MSDNKLERDFYLEHIFGPVKGRIQILNRKNQEIGYLKIKPFSKTYPLYFHDSNDPVITITEKTFSSNFDFYWGKEISDSQYAGSVKKKKGTLKIEYDFADAQNNEILRIISNFSGSKISIDKNLKIKKRGNILFSLILIQM